jgi:signal transduction histidine kinase/ligand-binding sensor domain-containing protein
MPRSARPRLRPSSLAAPRLFIHAARKSFLELVCVLLPLLSAATPAHALNPIRRLSQFAHTAWKMEGFGDGESPIAQTADGFMWFGSKSGLLRFDGVRFVPQTDINAKLPSPVIFSLAAAKDGSLWIGTGPGLSHLVNDELINYPDVTGTVAAILEARDGKIWFTATDVVNDYSSAFCLVVDHRTKCYGRKDGVLMQSARGLAEDADGNLWSSTLRAAVRWKPGSFESYNPEGLKSKRLINGVTAIVPTSAGFLWVGMEESGVGLGLQQLNQSKWKPCVTSNFNSSNLPVLALLLDREGVLWVGTEGVGLYRISGHTVDRFWSVDGLSSNYVHKIYQDREGNVWVTSPEGIDCFHETLVTTFSGPEGPGSDEADGVLAARDGTLWISRPGSLGGIREDKVFSIKAGKSLPGKQITSIFEDHGGKLWVGIDRTLSMYQNGTFHEIKRAGGGLIGLVVGLAEDTEDNIWAETIGPPRTLFRIRDLQIKEEFPAPKMPGARKVAADPQGGIWLGLMDGGLARYRKGDLQIFPYPHDKANSHVEQLTVSPDGTVWGTTSTGLIAWKNGKQQTLTVRNGLPCDNMFAHVFDKHDALWLYTACGLIEISGAELQRWWQQPNLKLQPRIFDAFDGAHPSKSYFNGAARTPDGRLWFVNSTVLQMVDPSHIAMNGLAPPVRIEEIIADRKSYSTRKQIRLPSLTRDLEIDYTGLSFVAPQKVRFRYKLENHDTDWQEPGTRRQAFYTDLDPGNYKFRVIACNNDGLWNTRGATLDFSVSPAWYQTNWFRLSCVAAFFTLLWALYQLRLHQLAKEFNTQLEASVAERTRIARELHDTLLQSFHGLMFRFQAARNMLPRRPEEAMKALDGAITRTEQAVADSRDAIRNLRGAPSTQLDMAESLTAMGQELASSHQADSGSPIFSVTVEGQPQRLSPMIQDEVCRIANEALLNSFVHAGPHQIEAEIRYGRHSLRLRFRDDGNGIDPETLKDGGKRGHWGLRGMRERAQRIHAQLDFWSEVGAGTEVQLTIPAAVAYERSRERGRSGFFGKWSKHERRS